MISVEEVKRALDGSPVLEAAAYWQQIRRLNTRINENLAQASQLRREGKIAEYVALEQEIDSDIDCLLYTSRCV